MVKDCRHLPKMLRPCSDCGTEFLARGMKHGFAPYCPDCRRARGRSRQRDYAQRHGGKTPEQARKRREAMKQTPLGIAQLRAHRKLQRAVSSGTVKRQPCEVCGAVKTHAHHEDYSKPLAVMWLCPLHHAEQHRKAA